MPSEPSTETTTQESGVSTTPPSSSTMQISSPVQPEVTGLQEKPESIPPSPSGNTASEEAPVEPALSVYEKAKGHKYSVDYFNIIDPFVGPENPFDKFRLRDNIKAIEWWVGKEIETRNLEDSLSSYDFVIQRALDTIGTIKYEKPQATIVRLGHYIRYVNMIRNADKTRPLWLATQT